MKLLSCLSFARRDKYWDERHIFLCQVPTVFLPMLLSVFVLILLVKTLGQQIRGSLLHVLLLRLLPGASLLAAMLQLIFIAL